MLVRLIRNDMLQNKTVALAVLLFVAAAAALLALAAILAAHLAGALGDFMERAKTPHFMQMHAGDLDAGTVRDFAARHPGVADWQIVEFLNVDGSQIRLANGTLADSVQDNGFAVQGRSFDFLLDLDGNPIRASDGELYVPLAYAKDGRVKVGDTAEVGGKTFVVAGFLRDSMMNASLSSSKRFLVSERDYAELRPLGRVEYLIEFRLKNPSSAGAFEEAYRNAGLPANGPAVTISLLRLMNALSDGILIGLLLMVALLVAGIAFTCIRLALLAKLEDDLRTIGMLKAIGFRPSGVGRLYLGTYAALAATGAAIGFAFALACKDRLLSDIRLFMGETGFLAGTLFPGLAGAALAGAAAVAFAGRVLKRIRSIPAAAAIRPDAASDPGAASVPLSLAGRIRLNVNAILALKDVLARRKQYAAMFAVLVIASFMLAVPQNLHHTLSSAAFVRHMGIGGYDLRIDVPPAAAGEKTASALVSALERDPDVETFAVYATKMYETVGEDGTRTWIKIELGDHAAFPVQYAEGSAPAGAGDIALSVLLAEELGKRTGDTVTIVRNGKPVALAVSGLYSDVTNGGKTAKAVFTDPGGSVLRSMAGVKLADPSLADRKAAEYAARFPEARVTAVQTFIDQTFGFTAGAVRQAAIAALAAAVLTAGLTTMLFVAMLAAKDRRPFAVMRMLGFAERDLTVQLAIRALAVLVPAAAIGSLLAATLGSAAAGGLIAAFGAASVRLETDPLATFVTGPLALAAAAVAGALAAARNAVGQAADVHLKE